MLEKPLQKLILSQLLLLLMVVAEAKESSTEQFPLSSVSAIINGTPASILSYPFAAFLANEQAGESVYCGASLISETWVLTAAHCFLNELGTAIDMEWAAGSTVILSAETALDKDPRGETGEIGQVIIHPEYDPDPILSDNTVEFDIALIELTAAVGIQPAKLLDPAEELSVGTEALVMGWGITRVEDIFAFKESVKSDGLKVSRQRVISNEECAREYGDEFPITENMLCTIPIPAGAAVTPCFGDSGGPLVISFGSDFVQIGVVNGGGTLEEPCGSSETPAGYASVAALADFIAEHASDAEFVSLDQLIESTPSTRASNVSVSIEGTRVNLQWTAVVGATGYNLYYAPYPERTPIISRDMGNERSVDAELASGDAYYVVIEAYNAEGTLPDLSNIAVIIVP
ncbi:MAG: serine protease [Gammaproteobacteria bacterium]|nr:serine protease [Gammaproteobacteria bacterium]MCY4359031.1 serine protease [Gammaproteobacteria bacterium]